MSNTITIGATMTAVRRMTEIRHIRAVAYRHRRTARNWVAAPDLDGQQRTLCGAEPGPLDIRPAHIRGAVGRAWFHDHNGCVACLDVLTKGK